MRKLLVGSICIMGATFSTFAQQIDYKKIILPKGAEVTFEERLVQLAWQNNPAVSISNGEMNIAESEIKHSRLEWTEIFGIQGNLNEFTIKDFSNSAPDNFNNQFFPRYNIYAKIPLSLFFRNPEQTKQARTNLEIASQENNLLKLEIRNTVLKLYSEVKRTEAIMNIRKEAMADEDSNYLLIEQRFKSGNASVDHYIAAQKSRNEQRILNINAKSEYEQAKLDLEQLIGVKLEEVQ